MRAICGRRARPPVLPAQNENGEPAAVPFSVNALFASYKPSIYQVRTINAATGQKTSIGSGFVIGDGKMIATNYHVIADAVNKEKHDIEYISTDDREGKLRLLAVDVVHDLAIVAADHELGKTSNWAASPNRAKRSTPSATPAIWASSSSMASTTASCKKARARASSSPARLTAA